METTRCHVHDIIFVLLYFCLIVFIIPAEAQPGSGQARDYSYSYFSPSVAIIIAVIMTSLFFMVFFTIYIRQCSGYSSAAYPTRGGAMVAMVHGLDRSIIDTFPTFTYVEVKEHKIVNRVLECAICLNEFEDDDTLRLIPKCDHVFHPVCIDAWLASHITCPVCRADLVTGSGDESVHVHDLTSRDNVENRNNIGDGSNSRDTEVVIQVEDEINQCQERLFNENSSSMQRNVLTRSWSLRPKKFGLGKFRSHSTGHSLVQREKNLERFTLRLSSEIRTVMINRASLNQVSIQAIMLPSVASSKKGFRPESRGEGSSRTGRSDQEIRSDRWAFLTRALSMRLPSSSPRVIEADKDSFSAMKPSEIKTPVKLSSFKCTIEENRSFPDEPDRV